MLFVDEFCGILVYIKFGADVTSQYVYVVLYCIRLWARERKRPPEA